MHACNKTGTTKVVDKDIYPVSDFLREARSLLEASYPYVWVEGEISSLSLPVSGHAYFSLKDEQAQVRCAFFKRSRSLSGYQPEDGDLVRIKARVTIYEARGDFQLIVQNIEEAGEGLLMRRFEDLKKKLAAEGLFDPDIKRPIPSFPATVGVISSPTGAAVRDVITTIGRRFPATRIVVYPSIVQGDGAPAALRTALDDAIRHEHADILIITRGGGSLEDLWCFNDEALARDIVACPIPTVSAVGHEIDFTICDFVADLRAPTPTAAGELVSPDSVVLREVIDRLGQRQLNTWQRQLHSLTQKTDWLQRSLVHPSKRIKLARERLTELGMRQNHIIVRVAAQWRDRSGFTYARLMAQEPLAKIAEWRRRLADAGARLAHAGTTGTELRHARQSGLAQRLNTVSPLATLSRGYSIASHPDTGMIIRVRDDAEDGGDLDVRLVDGVLHCLVNAHSAIKQ